MEINFIFVYGKLREYYTTEEIFDVESLISYPVTTSGLLYDYKGEAVLIENKDNIVFGNLLVANRMEILLRKTDNFMGFDEENYENSKYIRGIKKINAETLGGGVNAWCYFFPTTRKDILDKEGQIVECGNWLDYKKLKDK